MSERRYDIDWLRVLVMLLVFFFHCSRFFTGIAWHLNDSEQSIIVLIFTGVLDMWAFYEMLSQAPEVVMGRSVCDLLPWWRTK